MILYKAEMSVTDRNASSAEQSSRICCFFEDRFRELWEMWWPYLRQASSWFSAVDSTDRRPQLPAGTWFVGGAKVQSRSRGLLVTGRCRAPVKILKAVSRSACCRRTRNCGGVVVVVARLAKHDFNLPRMCPRWHRPPWFATKSLA